MHTRSFDSVPSNTDAVLQQNGPRCWMKIARTITGLEAVGRMKVSGRNRTFPERNEINYDKLILSILMTCQTRQLSCGWWVMIKYWVFLVFSLSSANFSSTRARPYLPSVKKRSSAGLNCALWGAKKRIEPTLIWFVRTAPRYCKSHITFSLRTHV